MNKAWINKSIYLIRYSIVEQIYLEEIYLKQQSLDIMNQSIVLVLLLVIIADISCERLKPCPGDTRGDRYFTNWIYYVIQSIVLNDIFLKHKAYMNRSSKNNLYTFISVFLFYTT